MNRSWPLDPMDATTAQRNTSVGVRLAFGADPEAARQSQAVLDGRLCHDELWFTYMLEIGNTLRIL